MSNPSHQAARPERADRNLETATQPGLCGSSGLTVRGRKAGQFNPLVLRILCAFVGLMSLQMAQAVTSVKLAWNPSTGPGIIGYTVYYGAASQAYTNSVSVGDRTTATIGNLVEGATYFFVVAARNQAGLESVPSNEVSYQVPSTPTDDSEPPSSELALLEIDSLGSVRNDYTGYIGCEIQVGSEPIVVATLGRFMTSGNRQTHEVKLVNALDGSDVPGGKVLINMAGGTPGEFKYERLASPIFLEPETAYYLVSQETAGGDSWHNWDTSVSAPETVGLVIAVVWGVRAEWFVHPTEGQSFGPVNFEYTPALPPITEATSFITAKTLGTPRNDYSGDVGMKVQIGPQPLRVTALGRIMVAGNRNTHTLKILRELDWVEMPGGSVSISMSGGQVGSFKYAELSTPVVLETGVSYYILSSETNGGDSWHNWNTKLETTTDAYQSGTAWGNLGVWYNMPSPGQAFGPVDFRYTIQVALPEVEYVADFVPGLLRNDFTGFMGTKLEVGSEPLTVTALGRVVVEGNSRTHTVKLVRAADGTDLPGGSVEIDVSSGTPGQFKYGQLSAPVTLDAGASYYLVSEETAGGDTFHNWNTSLTTTSVANNTAVVWRQGSNWYTYPARAQSFVPVSFKYIEEPPINPESLVEGESQAAAR